MKKTTVIIVDDSAIIRQLFTKILNSDPDIEVIATAEDPIDARQKIKDLNPDVITLDIEMPNMDGLSFLEKIMALRPMPVVMASSLTQKGAEVTFRALELGAVDYVSKSSSKSFDVDNLKDELIEKVKAAAKAKVVARVRDSAVVVEKSHNYRPEVIVAIGSSTGGVEALRDIVAMLPEDTPPVLITQHMPEAFTPTFARRLNGLAQVSVKEAENGEKIEHGHVYIAPGNKHLELDKRITGYFCKLHDGEKVSGHRPSVDVLFESVAKEAGDKAVGVILTGMGKDGAKGMLSMKKAGAFNIGQDENSCVVYGMPKAAYMAGAVDKQVPLSRIASQILQSCSLGSKK